ncbi:MAG: ABC transporter permease subunit [Christensenellales bacterium]
MNIFQMELKRNLKPLLIWSGVSAAVLALMMAVYPSMLNSDFMELMNAKLALMPKELLDMFHMSGQDIRLLPQFFANMFQFVLMASCIYGAILGVTALSREENEGTIEFLYAKPVRRSQIVSFKLAAVCTEYFIYFLILGAAAILACLCVMPSGLPLSEMMPPLWSVLFGGMVTGFTYLFLGFAISAFLRKANAASLAVALFFATYILGNIPALGVMEFLKWISPMNYFVPNEVIVSGINWMNALICVIVMGICAAVTYIVYNEKDFII